jgi:hypothetical protein
MTFISSRCCLPCASETVEHARGSHQIVFQFSWAGWGFSCASSGESVANIDHLRINQISPSLISAVRLQSTVRHLVARWCGSQTAYVPALFRGADSDVRGDCDTLRLCGVMYPDVGAKLFLVFSTHFRPTVALTRTTLDSLCKEWARLDSNQRPDRYERPALTN